MPAPSFDLFGGPDPLDAPASPVVVSVPHAGRDYPPALRASVRVPVAALVPLEDRWLDAVALGALAGETALVQRRARAWIDLNRGEGERDPQIDDGAGPIDASGDTAKLRSGLGLVPRRVGAAEIWRRRLGADEVAARIVADHRPYHAALATALAAARARFGIAVLLDLHSMPSLGVGQPQVIAGDRWGTASSDRFVRRVEDEAERAGLRWARNSPYAGAHVLRRHGDPAGGVHAVQLELDRRLYLDGKLDRPGAGLAATVRLVRRAIDVLADEAVGAAALAAE